MTYQAFLSVDQLSCSQHSPIRFSALSSTRLQNSFELDVTRCSRRSRIPSLMSSSDLGHVVSTLWKQYKSSTSSEVKIVDTYAAFCVATGIALHTNVALVGYFPFNAYLGALCTCMGGAVLAVCLRMQLDTSNQDFKSLAPERAYADFILAHLVLLLVAWNFIG